MIPHKNLGWINFVLDPEVKISVREVAKQFRASPKRKPKRKTHSSLVGFPLEKTHITCFLKLRLAAGLVEFHDHHLAEMAIVFPETSRILTGPQ